MMLNEDRWLLIGAHETCMYSMGPNPNRFGYIFKNEKDGQEISLPCRDYDYVSDRPVSLLAQERRSLLTAEFREVFDNVLLENRRLRERVEYLENSILTKWLVEGMKDAMG